MAPSQLTSSAQRGPIADTLTASSRPHGLGRYPPGAAHEARAVQSSGRTPIWEEPVRGFYTDPGQFVTLSGLDLLRSMLEGGVGPPIRYLFGLGLTSVEPGGVTFTMPVTDWLLFPQGVVSGATLGILVDAPLGCAVQTALPPATPFTTAEISFRFLRTVLPQSGTLTAKGRLIHAGKTTGVSLVEVTDEAGRLAAVTSTRCAILPRVRCRRSVEQALKNPPRLGSRTGRRPIRTNGRWQGRCCRRRSGTAPTASACCSPSSPVIYRRPRWPVSADRSCGCRGGHDHVEDAGERVAVRARPGQAYGGAIAMLAGTAIDGTVETTLPAGTAIGSGGPQGVFPAPGSA